MKKNLQLTAMALALGFATVTAQTGKVVVKTKVQPNIVDASTYINRGIIQNRGCATGVPSQQWEEDFQKQIAAYIAANPLAKGQSLVYNIPVIVHVIHGGQAIGTYPNISNAQINSQITVLNQDYAGTGFNVGNYPATAFANYATAAGLPAGNKDGNGRVKIANVDVTFCMATKDTTGATLATPGIDRINYTTKGWTNPASFSSSSTFQSYMDGTIKPGSIWNVRRYLNIWISDCGGSVGLLGYATFPVSSGNGQLSPPYGTNTTDGVWVYSAAFGSSSIAAGTYATGYDKGRSATHEIGHWLGLRHIGGDASSGCGIDGCADTPKNKGGFSGGQFGQNYGSPTYPLNTNLCTGGVDANVNGDMFMNFMDYTDDAAMYMFTTDQRTRCQTTMANSPYRNQLTASAATLCTAPASSAAIAAFSMTNSACAGSPVSTTNNSTGSPTPTFTWTSTGGASFSPNANAITPSITFPSAGNYTVTLSASNGTLSTTSKTISITTCTTAALCNDTITNISPSDTLWIAAAGSDTSTPGCSPKAGYIHGSNCYDDMEKAEYFAPALYSGISTPKIAGVLVLFYKDGTKGTGGSATVPVNMKLYNGTMASGPSPTVAIATATANIGQIVATPTVNNVTYCADPNVVYSTGIIRPYKYTFTTPVAAPVGGFFASVTIPTTAGDTAAIMTDINPTTSSMWELWSPGTAGSDWHNLQTAWGGYISNAAILPIITCSTVTGVQNVNMLESNITLMPNPTSGVVNVVTTLPSSQNLNLTVTNALGQIITTAELASVTNGYFTVDLSGKDNGVYFVTIKNNSTNEKVVRRIILSK